MNAWPFSFIPNTSDTIEEKALAVDGAADSRTATRYSGWSGLWIRQIGTDTENEHRGNPARTSLPSMSGGRDYGRQWRMISVFRLSAKVKMVFLYLRFSIIDRLFLCCVRLPVIVSNRCAHGWFLFEGFKKCLKYKTNPRAGKKQSLFDICIYSQCGYF